jgi:hypothetical protein
MPKERSVPPAALVSDAATHWSDAAVCGSGQREQASSTRTHHLARNRCGVSGLFRTASGKDKFNINT